MIIKKMVYVVALGLLVPSGIPAAAESLASDNYYDVLGVAQDATARQITERYRHLARANHPDRGGDTAVFQRIGNAYEILSNPSSRAAHDRALARMRDVQPLRHRAKPVPATDRYERFERSFIFTDGEFDEQPRP